MIYHVYIAGISCVEYSKQIYIDVNTSVQYKWSKTGFLHVYGRKVYIKKI